MSKPRSSRMGEMKMSEVLARLVESSVDSARVAETLTGSFFKTRKKGDWLEAFKDLSAGLSATADLLKQDAADQSNDIGGDIEEAAEALKRVAFKFEDIAQKMSKRQGSRS